MTAPRPAAEPPAAVLMYHLVADHEPDPWDCVIRPATFAAHLAAIARRGFAVLTVAELLRRRRMGALDRPTLAISFDDGYRLPTDLLAAHGMPATVYVTSAYVGGAREFWWDTVERVFLTPGTLPDRLELPAGGTIWSETLGPARHFPADDAHRTRAWRAGMPAPTPRHALFLRVWAALLAQEAEDRLANADRLLAWAGLPPAPRPDHRPMTADELAALARAGIEIGGHTHSHPRLGTLPLRAQWRELRTSRQALETLLGQPVTGLSLPHGSRSRLTPAVAAATGFHYVATSEDRPLAADDHRLAVPRLFVTDGSAAQFERDILDRVQRRAALAA